MHTFPAIIMSVARLIPSTSDSRQPYRLSNLLCSTNITNRKGLLPQPDSELTSPSPPLRNGCYLGDRVVDIYGRHLEDALLEHLVEVVYACGSLLRDAPHIYTNRDITCPCQLEGTQHRPHCGSHNWLSVVSTS